MILHLFIIIIVVLIEVRGHGRLIEPPSRSSMWRFGFKTEPNYNDNELFCGGYTVQWKMNGGKCGICGDPWHMKQPRENEAGGKYGKGIIVRNYTSGQVINAIVQLTANHKGYFEFKICPVNDSLTIATQECLDQHPLEVEETSKYKYVLPSDKPQNFIVHLKLPKSLVCIRCVLQWTYTSGNNWGPCPGGGNAMGCGPQETFRGCADIQISGNSVESDRSSSIDDNITAEGDESITLEHVTEIGITEHAKSQTVPIPTQVAKANSPEDYNACKGIGVWEKFPGMGKWCVINCAREFCPLSHCQCK